ncbi:hypothetical protein CANTEDRAFT_114872 [Yamadazyma tenuis ATCC 10573]|uniref:Uncharacterized protein n=2 Tax=Candida tenuis TaxID=2315449 RepID=G3BAB5_CANTC|nr:uncharacterized protein CANTEDRAFT_114872 [Yamadazyma tenuis ATCC 10573]XP_006687569.1 uncharacterized protein CANTEDRAFT_114872 [Yamadazyma tenuis ATCC 10573]EGV61398.1 hypothetical protein CANTEDRAFT_114872 [Yamadazyma tenuis ATCC 10573]EGV61399.1 hypothetical protein CANTEDRAFT_114872 [Yamadazyma tenuis ATCC 10573]
MIIQHLQVNFETSPPFSVLRMAEVLYDPKHEGYDLGSVENVSKYLHALARIVFVSSSVDDFPAPTFADGAPDDHGDPKDDTIPLIRIPWANDHKREIEGHESDESPKRTKKSPEGDDMDMSSQSIDGDDSYETMDISAGDEQPEK